MECVVPQGSTWPLEVLGLHQAKKCYQPRCTWRIRMTNVKCMRENGDCVCRWEKDGVCLLNVLKINHLGNCASYRVIVDKDD